MFKRICLSYFSGTGTTQKVVRAIGEILANDLGISNIDEMDFTFLKNRDISPTYNEEDIVIMGLPTIAGRVPNLMLNFLNSIKSNNSLGISIMTFGNRSFDDSLMELTQIMRASGMRVVAGGGFACEHSFSTILGKGRPDDEDMIFIEEFAHKIAEKIKSNDFSDVVVKGNDPIGPYYMPQDRNGNHIDIRKVKPKTNDKCIDCKLCAKLCPTGAIEFDDVSKVTGICMKCCACIKKCPVDAKYFDDEGYLYHKRELEEVYGVRRADSEYFL